MNRSAILHIPMSQYAYGVDENHVTIRVRTGRDDIDRCRLYFGDRACRKTPVDFTEAEMKVVAKDSLFDYFEVTLENPYKRLCYYFRLASGNEEILYYGEHFSDELVDDRSEYYQLPFNHRSDIVNPPEWAKKAVIYNIFPDSFATSKEYISLEETRKVFEENDRVYVDDDATRAGTSINPKGIITKGKLGGTIKGIYENVEYLYDLGVNAIYINPIFTAGEYHKYDLIDYYTIDPCFGTNDEFKALVDRFHKFGIRVIIDGVFNHCGWRFFAFEDVVKNGEKSRYKDWFYGLEFPVVRPDNFEDYPNYECFGYERMMPKLNTANKEVRDYFCNVGKYWVQEYDIDGWRLDVASEPDDTFWRCFYAGVKEIKKDAILIGEVWESAQHWLDGKIFDSAMNYDFRKHCRRFFAENRIDASQFESRVTDMYMRYRKQTVFAQLNVLDSHDVSRFLSLCGGNRDKYKLALVFQMCFPGMPAIFYGDELGVMGVMEDEYRQPMPWKKMDELYLFFKDLILLRKSEPILTDGDLTTLEAKSGSFLYIFERSLGDERIVIGLNMGKTCRLNPHYTDGTILMSKGYTDATLDNYGFIICKK